MLEYDLHNTKNSLESKYPPYNVKSKVMIFVGRLQSEIKM